ncbi:MAG: SPOR domain-containing protein [Bacteroidales bacterium]|nr:SPOR domain-containing protein [Bacteroidales bacterium]
MKKIITAAILSCMFLATFAQQQVDPAEEIKKQLNSDQLAQYEQAESLKAKGDNLMQQAVTKQNQSDKLKTQAAKLKKGKAKKLNKQADAIDEAVATQKNSAFAQYEKAARQFYAVYSENLETLIEECPANKKSSAQSHISEAETFFVNAQDKLKRTPTGKKVTPLQIMKVKEDADKSFNDALDNCVQAYADILGWYDKKEEPKPQPVIAQEPPKPADKIIYKVQIAADNEPLTIERLRQIYPSTEGLNNELVDGIYRYSVGFFNTYEEAAKARDEIKAKGVTTGVFIVAYKNGKRVSDITEVHPNN